MGAKKEILAQNLGAFGGKIEKKRKKMRVRLRLKSQVG